MKKAKSDKNMLPEYDFSKGILGKYANIARRERIRPNKALQTVILKVGSQEGSSGLLS